MSVSSEKRDWPLRAPLRYVKGVGPVIAAEFAKRGIETVGDAIYFLPRRYEDRRFLKKICDLQVGSREIFLAEIVHSAEHGMGRSRRRLFEAVVSDGTGFITLRWFHYALPLFRKEFQNRRRLLVCGEVKSFGPRFEILHPEIEWIKEGEETDSLHMRRIVPIYPEVGRLSAKTVRRVLKSVVDCYGLQVPENIPHEIIAQLHLPSIPKAIAEAHFPGHSLQETEVARRRLIFEELFLFELALALRYERNRHEEGIAFSIQEDLEKRLRAMLPFRLTAGQERVLKEIQADLASVRPMHRLLQGDVGSGKTIVGFMASLSVVNCSYQVALMAPTEVLAEQHYRNLYSYAERLGFRMGLLTSEVKGKQREKLLKELGSGEIAYLIGTHAVIQEGVRFHRLGLGIIDEQHRFGVLQRTALRQKGKMPDLLVMTATPIPRSLAMTVYGDLDLSALDEMPPGRKPVQTFILTDRDWDRLLRFLKAELARGGQAYCIYPLIEESEKVDLKNATQMAIRFSQDLAPDFQVGLLHGRMTAEEKESVLIRMKNKEIHLLVSTTVVEVGIDIPNATMMIVEHAERFGLSQLHQLRGRVGRGSQKSYCFLMTHPGAALGATPTSQRLKILTQTNNGFVIAEEDLKIRGAGEFLGVRQAGLPDFRLANLFRDARLLAEARRLAFDLIRRDPNLSHSSHQSLRRAVVDSSPSPLKLLFSG
ncbi:MAG: ATP-dependent DNA helicase RecG [Deltaproteobacteria bacterium]|nr:ATP-dependent DNA helicase RecG [Deltaproteobacteria bacterium]